MIGRWPAQMDRVACRCVDRACPSCPRPSCLPLLPLLPLLPRRPVLAVVLVRHTNQLVVCSVRSAGTKISTNGFPNESNKGRRATNGKAATSASAATRGAFNIQHTSLHVPCVGNGTRRPCSLLTIFGIYAPCVWPRGRCHLEPFSQPKLIWPDFLVASVSQPYVSPLHHCP